MLNLFLASSLGNFCICDYLQDFLMGDALAIVRILVVLGHEAGAESADAQVVGDAKLVQALADSFPQEDVQWPDYAGLAAQSAVNLAYDFSEGAALLGEGISQLIDLCESPASYEIQLKIIQLLALKCVHHFHLLPSVLSLWLFCFTSVYTHQGIEYYKFFYFFRFFSKRMPQRGEDDGHLLLAGDDGEDNLGVSEQVDGKPLRSQTVFTSSKN